MRQYKETKETQMTTEGSDISSKDRYLFYTRGRFIWITAKGGENL
jgi:hypothetical protein